MSRLAGLRVLVTRPGEEGETLAAAIRGAGGQPVLFPAMEIRARAHDAVLERLAADFPSQPWCVFISRNAVRHGVAWLGERGLWPTALAGDLAAVGPGSAAELARHGATAVVAPRSSTGAAALLALPRMADIAGRRMVVFCGVGGSDGLRRALGERGAHVSCAEVYERVAPARALRAALLRRVDLVTATSSEALRNLYTLADTPATDLLNGLPLLVTSEQAARDARARGHRISPIITPLVSNEQIVEELATWRTNQS